MDAYSVWWNQKGKAHKYKQMENFKACLHNYILVYIYRDVAIRKTLSVKTGHLKFVLTSFPCDFFLAVIFNHLHQK